MQKIMSFLTSKEVKAQVDKLSKVFENLPHLPKKIVEIIVKITPFFVLLGAIGLSISAIQNLFGFNRVNHWFSYWINVPHTYFYILGVLEALTAIIFFLAYAPLRDRKINGWILLFWTTALEIVGDVTDIIFAYGGLIGSLIGLAISLYLLFEMRPFYEEKKTTPKKVSKSKAVSKKKSTTKKSKKK